MISVKPVFNRTNKLSKDGKGTVEIRLTLDRKPSYYNTKIKIIPQHWDKKTNSVKKNNENWFTYNKTIDKIHSEIEKYNAETNLSGSSFNIAEVKKILSGETKTLNNIIEFIDNEIKQRISLAESTKKHHKSKLKIFKTFLTSDIPIKKVDYDTIQSYNIFLTKKGYSVNTIWNHHKFFKTYLNFAIKKKIISINPYIDFKIETEQTEREYLTLEEIKLIEKIELENGFENYQLVIDKFLFSCYTGLRISDLQSITNSCFSKEGEKTYLTFRMQKTIKLIRNMPLHLLFNGKAVDIYNKYKSLDQEQTLFPKQAEQKINEMLKDVANLAKINKNLTFHVARHSFGSALARVYNDVLLIKELMGHGKLETSMIYIHMNPAIIEEKLSKKEFIY